MKRFTKAMVTMAVVAAMAVPAVAADKLVVQNGGGASVFAVTDTGKVSLPVATGVARSAAFFNAGTADNFA